MSWKKGMEIVWIDPLVRKGESRAWEKDAGLGKHFEDKWKCQDRYDGNLRPSNSEGQGN